MKRLIMKTHIIAALGLAMSLSISSCSDFMNLTPEDQYDEETVWSDAGLVQAVVNDVYAYIRHGSDEVSTTALTDDAYFTHNYGIKAINETAVSGSDLQWYDNDNCPFRWSNCYKGIYRANLVLKNIDNVPEKVGYDVKMMKGETLFLRAYLYSQLVRGFGGVPLVDKIYSIEEASKLSMPRNSVKECLDFIISDLDQAIELLPETVSSSDLGRATKGAAIALKARMYLHLASPLYADRTVNTLACNQYDGDRKVLYEKALESAKAVINSGVYSLVDCNAGNVAEIANNFHSIITTNNAEMIFTKQFINKFQNADNNVRNRVALCHGPNGYHNWAGVTPTNDLVMSFEMEDGSINSSMFKAGETTTMNPFLNREPRFYATIGYDGAEWGRPRPSDSQVFDPTPMGTLQMGFYELSSGGGPVDAQVAFDATGNPIKTISFTGVNGVDTRRSSVEDWNGSFTGYLEKKLIDTSFEASESMFQTCPYPFIRLAEMYLIAAESCIELNRLDEAVSYLDALRNRIGRPDTKATLNIRNLAFNQSNLREFLRLERRSELSYEDSRYYDIRRWMIAPEMMSKSLTGIAVVARLKPGKTASAPYVKNPEIWDYQYFVTDLTYRETRKWNNKLYFAPIKRDEINRNPAMVQNPGME